MRHSKMHTQACAALPAPREPSNACCSAAGSQLIIRFEALGNDLFCKTSFGNSSVGAESDMLQRAPFRKSRLKQLF